MRILTKYAAWVVLIIITVMTNSCEKMIDVDGPRSQLPRSVVFEDDLTAVAAVSGLYSKMTALSGNFSSITYPASLSADEMMVPGQGAGMSQFYRNDLLSVTSNISLIWNYYYNLIYVTNSIIEGLENSTKVTASLKKQLLGEAKFIRAFGHFYLVNLFGDVPYVDRTDFMTNSIVKRIPVSDVYEKIKTDLIEAKGLLSSDYTYSSNERVRANKWAAAALLARVYLYTENWTFAEAQADEVINNTSMFTLVTDLNKVFLKNSSESILQLIPSFPNKYTEEGRAFCFSFTSSSSPIMTSALLNGFEANDQRKAKWTGTATNGSSTWSHPYKFKENAANGTGAEYSTVFRLAEQYLIRAESRVKQNKLGLAAIDINTIRQRSGLGVTNATTQSQLLLAVEQERRVELFTEYGHRWLDLKRTGRATAVLGPLKPGWTATDALYPIPYSELQLNPYMTQNPGY